MALTAGAKKGIIGLICIGAIAGGIVGYQKYKAAHPQTADAIVEQPAPQPAYPTVVEHQPAPVVATQQVQEDQPQAAPQTQSANPETDRGMKALLNAGKGQ